LQAIDLAALQKLRPLDPDTAANRTASALSIAKLPMMRSEPTVGHEHTILVVFPKTGEDQAQKYALDTSVRYEFNDGRGHSFVGPGAVIQVTYGNEGQVIRLQYATRQIQQGPAVTIVPETAMRDRVTPYFRHMKEIKLQLVYWCPSLHALPGDSVPLNPGVIIPWYAISGSSRITDPKTGEVAEVKTKIELIPATDDRRFVPHINLNVQGGTQITAKADVDGGRAPYIFEWSGSAGEIKGQHGKSICYTPTFRDLQPLNSALSRKETVTVTVRDANGVTARQFQSVDAFVTATTQGKPKINNLTIPAVSYGIESPREPDFASDRLGWEKGMGEGGAAVTEAFSWQGDLAWPGDFVEPVKPGVVSNNPWIDGNADYENWGINTAAIVLNNTDGAPDGFNASNPGAAPEDYPTAFLWAPSHTGLKVEVGLDGSQPLPNSHYGVQGYDTSWSPNGSNHRLLWLAMDNCDVLDSTSTSGTAAERWGRAFGGLHTMLGWNSAEYVGDGSFEQEFAENMLGVRDAPQTIVQAWFHSAEAAGAEHGVPAALMPIASGNVTDETDYFLGRGTQGPSIAPANITNWLYLTESSSLDAVLTTKITESQPK
jgi:hypothetical protein